MRHPCNLIFLRVFLFCSSSAFMDDSKKQLSSGQKKRKQYRKHFLPEKKKEKMKQKEKIKRTFEVIHQVCRL